MNLGCIGFHVWPIHADTPEATDELRIDLDPSPGIGDTRAQALTEPQSIEPLLERSRADLASGLMDAPWPPVYPKMPNEPPQVAPSRARATD